MFTIRIIAFREVIKALDRFDDRRITRMLLDSSGIENLMPSPLGVEVLPKVVIDFCDLASGYESASVCARLPVVGSHNQIG